MTFKVLHVREREKLILVFFDFQFDGCRIEKKHFLKTIETSMALVIEIGFPKWANF